MECQKITILPPKNTFSDTFHAKKVGGGKFLTMANLPIYLHFSAPSPTSPRLGTHKQGSAVPFLSTKSKIGAFSSQIALLVASFHVKNKTAVLLTINLKSACLPSFLCFKFCFIALEERKKS